MVRQKCEVIDCCNEKSSSVSLHGVPKDDVSARKWLKFLELANGKYSAWKLTKKVVVCSDHFTPQDFRYGVSGIRLIKPGCFPNLVQGVDVYSKITGKVTQQGNSGDESQRKLNFQEVACFQTDVSTNFKCNRVSPTGSTTVSASASTIFKTVTGNTTSSISTTTFRKPNAVIAPAAPKSKPASRIMTFGGRTFEYQVIQNKLATAKSHTVTQSTSGVTTARYTLPFPSNFKIPPLPSGSLMRSVGPLPATCKPQEKSMDGNYLNT